MAVLLVIGEVQSTGFVSAPDTRRISEVRLSAEDATQGGGWCANEEASRLRQLLGCEPTDVIGIVMTEQVWVDSYSIVNAQRVYFTACEAMWVVRPDGKVEYI